MISLYDLVNNNKNLKYLDISSGRFLSLKELRKFSFPKINKSLFFVYLDNSIISIELFWSLMQSSHCFAILPPNMSNDLKINLEKIYNPTFIYDPLRSDVSGYNLITNFDIPIFQSCENRIQIIHEDIKILLSTSGTTGSPKFVKLSESNIVSNAQSITEYLPIVGTDVTPLNLPLYYSYGLSILTSNSLNGGTIVCTNEDIFQKNFWANFTKYGYTSISGVPFIYEMLHRIGFTKKNYPSLRYITQAGGKLQNNLLKNYAEYSKENQFYFYVMYGQTEATARMSYLSPNDLINKLGSIGKPIPGGKFLIDKATGELCYQGKNVFGGYVSGPNDLKTYKQPEFLFTGDLAYQDDDGFFFITGRLKRFVKLFGSRINLDEVETLIANNTKYVVKCIGVCDKFLVIYHNDPKLPEQTIKLFIADRLKLHLSVIKTIFIDYYPMTDNNKINYKELLKIYES
jgi:long-chain acyl-CoA synthetase